MTRSIWILQVLLLNFSIIGCATLESEDEADGLSITATSQADFPSVAFKTHSGLASYSYKKRSYKAEWIVCRPERAELSIIVMHQDKKGFDRGNFCSGWLAQTFLSEKADVITINRPGFSGSTGTADFVGPQSIAALAAGWQDASMTIKNLKPLTGIWGYSSGATAAAILAKKLKGLRFLILGGGVYDLEETAVTTKDSYIKRDIEFVRKTAGDEGIEVRSIAYDIEGLPKKIALYHGKKDKAVLPKQAESFRDSLISGEYDVTLQVLKGVSHTIPLGHHRQILKVLFRSVSK